MIRNRLFRSIPILLAFGSANAAEEFNSAAPGLYQDPGVGFKRSIESKETPDRIDPFTGALKIVTRDIVLPGNGGLDIEVIRNYQGVTNTSGPYSNGYKSRTPFGTGWDIHFGRIWMSERYPSLPSSSNNKSCQIGQIASNLNPIIEHPDGTRETLVNGNGTRYAFITKSRWIAECLPPSQDDGHGGLIVYSPKGLKYTFNLKGTVSQSEKFKTYLVTKIEDPSGNRINIQYNQSSTSNLNKYNVPTRVTSSDGRTLTFNYNNLSDDNALLTGISGGGKNLNYHYINAGYAVGKKAQYLTQVSNPDNTYWKYEYNDANIVGNVPGRYSMTWMKTPQGANVSYAYDYKQMGSQPTEKTNVVISRRISSLNGFSPSSYEWSYNYIKGYNKNDITVESGPSQCITYEHIGANTIANGVSAVDRGLWKIGLLQKKTIGANCNQPLRVESYSWDYQNISEQNEMRRYNLLVENYTRAPLLEEKIIQQDGGGYATSYKYDTYGQPIKIDEYGDRSRTTNISYAAPGSKWLLGLITKKTISGISGSQENTYNSAGLVTRENYFGTTTQYTYHSTGDLASKTDANNRTTHYSDYHRGIPRKEAYPDGSTISREVSTSGLVTSIKNELNQVTNYTYDQSGRVTSISPPKGLSSKISISYNNTKTVQTLSRGSYSRVRSYTESGQIYSQVESGTDVRPRVQRATYSPIGGRTFLSNPNFDTASSSGESFTYDALGRVTSNKHADGSSITYKYGASSVSTTNERSNSFTNKYISFGDPDERYLVKVTEPNSIETVIAVDNLGRTKSITQGGLIRSYDYSTKGFLERETNPETGVTIYSYDAVGNVLSKKIGEAPATGYTYDERDRLTRITYDDGQIAEYRYNLLGNITSESTSGIENIYEYDSHNNIIRETISIPSISRSYGFFYPHNEHDVPDGVTYPSDRLVLFMNNSYGQATQASGNYFYASNISYHANGELKELKYANGLTLSTQIDAARQRITNRTTGASTRLISTNYEYDPSSNLTTIKDLVDSSLTQNFKYDSNNRLTNASGPQGESKFTYNTLGDITSFSANGKNTSYTFDSQGRLSNLSGGVNASLKYDAKGNVTQARGTYIYNSAGYLTHLCIQPRNNCSSSPDQRFTYDARGMRVLQTQSNGDVKVSIYGKFGLMLEENLKSQVSREYIYVSGELIAKDIWSTPGFISDPSDRDRTLDWVFYHNDHLGSPIAASDRHDGLLKWRTNYSPYGERQTESTPQLGSIGYTGHVYEGPSNLVYAGARYYDPSIGRFLSTDPAGVTADNPISFNRYAYANNNPHAYTDPDGRVPLAVVLLLGGGFGGSMVHSDYANAPAHSDAPTTMGVIDHVGALPGATGLKSFKASSAIRNIKNPPIAAHGNKIDSRPATLYEKYSKDGTFLKHGITKHENPHKRYTKSQIDGGWLVRTDRGPRSEMIKKERDLVERIPGPENRERWAGKRLGE